MHRRLLPLALLLALALAASSVQAVPPPPEASQAAAVLSAPEVVQLTDFDVRFQAVAEDSAGQIFVAASWPGYKIRVCKLIRLTADQWRLEPMYDPPGEKHANVSLVVLQNGDLFVSWASRPPGAISGPFYLYATILPGVATPQPRFGVAMPVIIADSR
jgi:hypothetical protein